MKEIFKKTFISLVLIWCVLTVFSQAGTLDPNFGNNGKLIFDIGSDNDFTRSSVIQKDGKVIVAGTSVPNIILVRFKTDGSIDSSFGLNGIVLVNPGSGFGVRLQEDDKILVTGSQLINNKLQLVLGRYLPDGSPDNAFGNNGIVMASFDGQWQGQALSVRNDKKIVVLAYSSYDGQYINSFGLFRFNENGVPDSTFGYNGLVKPSLGDYYTAWSMQLTKDENILVCGYKPFEVSPTMIQDSLLVMRFTSSGIPDSSFGNNSMATAFINSQFDYHSSLEIDKQERILASGFSSNGDHGNFALVRFTSEGKIDSSFAANGIAITEINKTSEESYAFDNPFALAIQADGKILQAGSIKGQNNADFGIVRFQENGKLDSSFGTNGISITALTTGLDIANSIAIQQDGKIIVAGNGENGGKYDVCLARYFTETVVPLHLLNFVAHKGQHSVNLSWQTMPEIEIDYFIVEKSDRSNSGFKTIGKVNVINSTQLQLYSFEDRYPFNGVNYFRLKQVDKDGQVYFSKIILVNFGNINIRLYPNPASIILNIDGLKQDEKSNLSILTSNGEIVAKTIADSYRYSWNISSLPAGTYFLKIKNDESEMVQQFIKQ